MGILCHPLIDIRHHSICRKNALRIGCLTLKRIEKMTRKNGVIWTGTSGIGNRLVGLSSRQHLAGVPLEHVLEKA
jgi:hypothetical protein